MKQLIAKIEGYYKNIFKFAIEKEKSMKAIHIIHNIRALLFLSIALVLGSCEHQEKFKIAVSQCSDDDWRSKMNEEIMREAMFHDNIDVEIRSADDNSQKQIADLQYFMDHDFDIIIVAPNEAESLTPIIKGIYESGKPVVVFDRTINGDYYTAFQGADNEGIGKMAAKLVQSMVPEPRVLEIKGLKGSTPAELRRKGFHEVAHSLGVAVLGEQDGNWNFEEAKKAAVALLAKYPQTNVFYCHNDRMALGAAEAAKEAGRDDIKIIGIDAAPKIGIKAVDEGLIDATFLYPTDGHLLIRTALDILQGKPFERDMILPTPSPVDASNAQILLLQDKALREETDKISFLQDRMDSYSRQYSLQKTVLYATIAILALCAILIFVLMRSYWSSKRHHRQIEDRNRQIEQRNVELARQRDELDGLYHQLQEATGSKLTFFTNVSHDLRTPLTLIADPVNRLAEADNLTPQQHTLMQLASKNVKRLQRLINQILDIRKYDNGQLKLNLVNINLSETMREWIAPFADIAARRHIRFNSEIPQAPAIITAIDVEKTERILFNLLSNAFKFTPENGNICVSLHSDGTNAIIKVSDTGIGISAEDINNIFERFFKTDRINPNGSGIGLALSKVFIDMQGGSISVESQEGKGSTFTVKLPIRQINQEEAQQKPEALPQADLSELADIEDEDIEVAEDASTVLIIDDNHDICTLVKSVLSEKYTVLVASSGAQGIRLATRYVPDLVISDVMMPGMDGYEVCKALKKESLTSHIPVLLLTACSRDEQRTQGYECGADAYMAKPFDSEMLMARCKSLLDNRRLIYEKTTGGEVATQPDKNASSRPSEDEFLARFIKIVEKEISNSELSVESIADHMGLSRVQMYRKIKALTNYSAAEMIRNIRLKQAAKMLKTSDATVSEVAYSVGFSSPSYFSRCYKDYFGESPIDTQNRTSKAR